MPTIDLHLHLHPRQREALDTLATEVLFGGATRGGKSHFIRVALIVWCLSIPNLQCILIRKKIDDILNNHVHGPNGFKDLLRPLIALGKVKITEDHVFFVDNESRIVFKHCQDERQFDTAQGISTHVLVVDEATQISDRLIRTFRAWCTMPEEMKRALPDWAKGRFPRIIYTANPVGISVPFFRKHFVEARPVRAIERVDGFLRQFIPSLVRDNPSEDEAATRGRVQGMHDSRVSTALLEANWNALTGEFFPEWNESRHVVPDFTPPPHWFRFRGMDLGYAEPFCVHWVAVSDGETFRDSEGRERWFPRGAFIVYREWYGCDAEEPSKGISMRNEDIASGILERSEHGHQNVITLTDSLPFQDRGGEGAHITFQRCGVPLTLGDVSRVVGWNQLRARLIGAKLHASDDEKTPMMFWVESCKAARDYFPALPRHPSEGKKEDAAEHGEPTHVCDTDRIISMAHTVIKDSSYSTAERFEKELKKMNKPRTINNLTGLRLPGA